MITFKAEPPGTRGDRAERKAHVRSTRGDLDEVVFFSVPSSHGALLAVEPDVFLPLAGILGLVRGEDVDLGNIAVDALLQRNVAAALRQYASWYPHLTAPRLSGLHPTKFRGVRTSGTATFFTGGIDSLFSLIRHSEGRSVKPEAAVGRDLQFALHVYHTPVPEAIDGCATTLRQLAATGEEFGVAFVPVASNIMTFDPFLNDHWADIGHGAGLSTVLHVLSGCIGTGLIPSSDSYGDLTPWGSSPITDPLWSSTRLKVIHDGSTFTRVEKTAEIASKPVALAGLNVCDTRIDDVGYVNCGHCEKCLRTMITLDLLGKGSVETCPSFDWSSYSPAKFGGVLLRNGGEVALAAEIRDAAERLRPDIVAACDKAIFRSRLLRGIGVVEARLKHSWFGRNYRSALKQKRDVLYRKMGWGSKWVPE